MFTKSGADINKIEASWRGYSPGPQRIIFAAAEELFARSTADFLPSLQRIAEPLGLFLDGNSQLTLLLIWEVDAYIRFKRANLVMNAILRYPVDVFGTGWDHVNWDGAAAQCHGATTWRTMIDQLPHYVGSLSINPLVEGPSTIACLCPSRRLGPSHRRQCLHGQEHARVGSVSFFV